MRKRQTAIREAEEKEAEAKDPSVKALKSSAEAKGIMFLAIGSALGVMCAFFIFSQVELTVDQSLEELESFIKSMGPVVRVIYSVLLGALAFFMVSMLLSSLSKYRAVAKFTLKTNKVLLFVYGYVFFGGVTALIMLW